MNVRKSPHNSKSISDPIYVFASMQLVRLDGASHRIVICCKATGTEGRDWHPGPCSLFVLILSERFTCAFILRRLKTARLPAEADHGLLCPTLPLGPIAGE